MLCVHVKPGEGNNGAQGPRCMSLRPNNTHSCRESHGQGSSVNPCLLGSFRGTFPGPPICSHGAESLREPRLQVQVQPPGSPGAQAVMNLSGSLGPRDLTQPPQQTGHQAHLDASDESNR